MGTVSQWIFQLHPPLAMSDSEAPERYLRTVRDWLRYAVSRFNSAELIYGHGTATALDEAAFLILHTLKLPIDQLEPWLDARLLPPERAAVRDIIERRISTRKPAPYLTNEAWAGGHAFHVDERVIVPRSYIAELLAGGLSGVVAQPAEVRRVLDLCSGSGCLAILAALTFENAAVDAAELSPGALEVAEHNLQRYGLADRIRLVRSDLFDSLPGQRYDLILANPPYVSDAKVAAFPPEYAAEPAMAHAGGSDGLDIVRRILTEAPEHLTERGRLVVEIGTGRKILERELPEVAFVWLDTEESEGEVMAVDRCALSGTEAR
jgi:ribosomal protein L3 glutamine methyltransferase